MAKKKKRGTLIGGVILFFKIIWFILKIPYHIVRRLIIAVKWLNRAVKWYLGKYKEVHKITIRSKINAVYEEMTVAKTIKGKYEKWLNELFRSDSKIGIIIGARGSGKTAFGVKILEEIYSKTKRKCYAMGFNKDEMPLWINVIENISELTNNSFVLIDEGGILFSSRNAMTNINKLLTELMLVARHKNISILFISQNSSNLDVNILRQADYLVLKQSSLLQKDFERKIVQKTYDDVEEDFNKYKRKKGITYIHSNEFKGFVINPLPSFWNNNISKSFR
ncbi:MAG: zonular occludens toxin domain-containing protein [Nanoarchaeota archaeon]|nr:zonular occludens toxin domain-containing protein [Nanoarchaeota archaeon]